MRTGTIGGLRSFVIVGTIAGVGLLAQQARGQASITVSPPTLTSGQVFNLTNQGPTDWTTWGSSLERDAAGGNQIHNYTLRGGQAAYDSDPTDNNGVDFSWSNGTPNPSGSATGFVYVDATSIGISTGSGFQFTVQAVGPSGDLRVWLSNYEADTNFSAALQDSNGTLLSSGSDTSFNNPGGVFGSSVETAYYDVSYSDANPGDSLVVNYSVATDDGVDGPGYVGLQAAALHGSSVATPEPAAFAILGIAGLGALIRRRPVRA